MRPDQLDADDLLALVEAIHETLWPGGDPNHEWSADTTSTIANIMCDAGIGLREPPGEGIG